MKKALVAMGALVLLAAMALATGPHIRGDIVDFTSQLVAGPASTVNFSTVATMNMPAGEIAVGSLTPGINGQCVNTNGGGAIWGSCAGTAGVQTLSAQGSSPVTVNANTTSGQVMMSFTFSNAALNTLNKQFRVSGGGTVLSNSTQNVNICTSEILGCNIPGSLTGGTTYGWQITETCDVISTGAGPNIYCDNELKINSAGGVVTVYQLPGSVNYSVGSTPTTQFTVQFLTTGSTSNTATQKRMTVEQLN